MAQTGKIWHWQYNIRIYIGGPPWLSNYEDIAQKIDNYITNLAPAQKEGATIALGTGDPSDFNGIIGEYARAHDYKLRVFVTDWDLYGKGAGYRQNQEVADWATHALIFHNQTHKGTKFLLTRLKKNNIPTHEVRPPTNKQRFVTGVSLSQHPRYYPPDLEL